MPDKKTRLLEAERALHSLEIQIEQYRLHLKELAQHPREATKARAMLDSITTELALQRKYCSPLRNAVPPEERELKWSAGGVARCRALPLPFLDFAKELWHADPLLRSPTPQHRGQ